MKGFLIDPILKHIYEVGTPGQLHDIYQLIDCDCIDTVAINDEMDVLYVDDNGLSKYNQSFFAFANYPNPLAGTSLALGTTLEGETVSVKAVTLKQLHQDIEFISRETALVMADAADIYSQERIKNIDDGFQHIYIPIADIIRSTGYTKESEESA